MISYLRIYLLLILGRLFFSMLISIDYSMGGRVWVRYCLKASMARYLGALYSRVIALPPMTRLTTSSTKPDFIILILIQATYHLPLPTYHLLTTELIQILLVWSRIA